MTRERELSASWRRQGPPLGSSCLLPGKNAGSVLLDLHKGRKLIFLMWNLLNFTCWLKNINMLLKAKNISAGPIQAINHQSATSGFSKANVWNDRDCLESTPHSTLTLQNSPLLAWPPHIFLPINKEKIYFLKKFHFLWCMRKIHKYMPGDFWGCFSG